MIYKLLFFIFLANNVLADDLLDISCDEDNKLAIPNCITKDIRVDLKKGNLTQLCEVCRPKFEEQTKIFGIKKDDKKINLTNTLQNELLKSLSSNLINIASLRSAHSLVGDYSKAINACDFKNFKKNLIEKDQKTGTNCSKGIDDIEKKLVNELGLLLSPKSSNKDIGVLKRSLNSASCLAESDIMRAKAQYIEENLDINLINKILSTNTDGDFEKNLESSIPDNLVTMFSTHPVFANFLKDPKILFNILKGFPSSKNRDDVIKYLYKSQDISNGVIENISSNCQKAFDTYLNTACTDNIKNNSVNLQGTTLNGPILGKIDNITSKTISDSDDINKNFELIGICEIKNDKNALKINESLKEISSGLKSSQQQMILSEYQLAKYQDEFGDLQARVCKLNNEKCEEPVKDVSDKPFCRIRQLAKPKEGTVESRLASSSDENVNKLLRSFIGEPKDLSPEVKDVLVKEGILPKEDGKYVVQPDVPERRPNYFQRSNEAVAQVQPQVANQTNRASASNYAYATPSFSNDSAPAVTPDEDDGDSKAVTTKKSIQDQQALSDIERKMLEKLMKKQKSTNSPISKNDIRDEISNFYKENNLIPPTPVEQEKQVEKIANAIPAMTPSSNTEGTAKLGKREKESFNDALLRNNPAVAAAAKAEAEAKNSPVVTIQGLDQVQVSVDELLNESISKNTNEGQLIKHYFENKKDFVLKLKDCAFRINFNKERNTFELNFEPGSGDKYEAIRIKPKLLQFFQNLNAKLASNLSKDTKA